MGFTYIEGSNLPLHLVRAKIGDVQPAARKGLSLEDEEILERLAAAPTTSAAALACLDLLLPRFAREVDSAAKGGRIDSVASLRFERLQAIRLILVEEVSRDGGPSNVMLSESYRQAQIADADLIQHPTREGAFDADW